MQISFNERGGSMSEEKRKWDNKQAIGFRMKAVNNMIRRKLDIRFAEAGMEELIGMQGPMLGFLADRAEKQDIFQKDIEKEFNIRRSTATVMLQNLEQKGYIVRESMEYDARLKKIVLTEKAIEANRAIHKEIAAFNEELESGITSEEKELFFSILDKVMKNLA